MVMAVFDKAFDIFILRLGVTKRVYCDVSKYIFAPGSGFALFLPI